MRFAREALPFVLPFALLAAGLLPFRRYGWAAAAALGALVLLLFFRIPARRGVDDPDAVLAPANGRVTGVDMVEAADLGPGRFRRIVTFLSVFDVHVQRAPVAGRVIASRHRPGRKVAAFRADAGEVNESLTTLLRTPAGELVGVRQIAGLLARRAVNYLDVGAEVERGELIGLIKFGSRVDLLLPERYEVAVRPGDRVFEGLTAVARPPAAEATP